MSSHYYSIIIISPQSWVQPISLSGTRVLHFQPPIEQKNEEFLVVFKPNKSNTELFFSQKQLSYFPICDKDMRNLTRFSGLKVGQ